MPSRRLRALPLAALLVAACQSDKAKVDPEALHDMHVGTALAHYDLGDMPRALDQAQRALEIEPDDKAMLLLGGWCYMRMGSTQDLVQAQSIFLGVEKKFPDDLRAKLGTAKTSERLALINEQTAKDVESGKRLPVGATVADEVTRLRKESKRLYGMAEDRYRMLVETKSENIEALNGMVRITGLTGRPEESLTYAGRLIEELDKQRVFYARQLERREMQPSEEQSYRKLERDATTLLIDTRELAANLHFDLGRPSLALAHLDAAIELDPKDRPDLYAQRAQVYMALDSPARALEDLDLFIARSTLPVEHPEVQKAWQMRRDARTALALKP
ncbi:MAG: tetratricopeptide repeat protein [Planctomycetota bacterium]